jgi:YbbR domain-containing protein
MKNWRKDWGLKTASVLVALVLWLYVQSQTIQNSERTVLFKVLRPDLASAGLVVTKYPETIKVRAQGAPEAIHDLDNRIRANPEQFVATIDLANPQAGVNQYPVYIQRDSVRDVGLSWSRPDRVIVAIEPREQSSPKRIVVDPVDVPPGYAVSADVSPETVILSGPKSDLSRVTQVVAKLSLRDYFKDAGKAYQVDVSLRDADDHEIKSVVSDPSKVSVHAVLSETVRRKNVPISANWIGQLELGYKVSRYTINPDHVWITGDPDKIKDIDTVETEPVDVSGITFQGERRVKIKPLGKGIDMNHHVVRVTVEVTPTSKPLESPPPQETAPSKPGQ